MNLIFLDSSNEYQILSLKDKRTKHVLEVLKMGVGQKFYVGIPQREKGLAEILKISYSGIEIHIQWKIPPLPLYPVECVIGLPRPQTARKILQGLTSLGIKHIHFFQSEKGEPSYAQSSLWTTDEWKQQLLLGAEQAFVTTFPQITHHIHLKSAIDSLYDQKASQDSRGSYCSLALDVYEANQSLSQDLEFISPSSETSSLTMPANFHLYIGSERGWSDSERTILRDAKISLCHLGARILRTEIACITACSLVLNRFKVF